MTIPVPPAQPPRASVPSSSSSNSLPPRVSLLQNISTQSFLLNQLFALVASPPAQPPAGVGVNEIYSALLLSTLDLSSLVSEAHEHQAQWGRLQEKKIEVEALERRVRGLISSLERGRGELEEMVDRGREVSRDIERSQRDPIPVPRLLSTAQSLARHSSAPVSSLLANIDKDKEAQPWPSEMAMRQGLLFQLEGSMAGMGERGVVGDQPTGPGPQEQPEPQAHVQEEPGRRYDPHAVFDLALNSDESDDE